MLRLALASLLLPASAMAQTVDSAPFAQSDLMGHEIGTGLSQAAITGCRGSGAWAGGFAHAGVSAPDSGQEADLTGRGLVLGYGTRWGLSPFIGYGQGATELSDGITEARFRSYFYGLAFGGARGTLRWDAALFTGGSHNVISVPNAGIMGSADFDGRLSGVSAHLSGPLRGSLDFAVAGNLLLHRTEGQTLGNRTTQLDTRDSLSAQVRSEVSIATQMGGLDLRPFAALEWNGGSADDLTITTPAAVTRIAAQDVTQSRLSLGSDFDAGRMTGRFEASADTKGDSRIRLTLGLGF